MHHNLMKKKNYKTHPCIHQKMDLKQTKKLQQLSAFSLSVISEREKKQKQKPSQQKEAYSPKY